MNNKTTLLILVLGLFLVAACSQQPIADDIVGGGSPVDVGGEANVTDTSDKEPEFSDEVKEFEIIARNWEFAPNTIRVNLGDRVELHVESVEGTHGFLLPEFGVNEILEPGNDVHVNFVADKKGTFTFACSVPCGRGHGDMRGQLIVE
ncbi:MAG: cupredoxin domain-containing protein [Nanoarchaeota archaeon]|nr:cupredoxin domain-containing protein [DPANN group archaeon]MBL7116210.1 cupredoxin domain-containing protein [Nanoarchaeota archaeon]